MNQLGQQQHQQRRGQQQNMMRPTKRGRYDRVVRFTSSSVTFSSSSFMLVSWFLLSMMMIFLGSISVFVVESFPTGAGSCNAGNEAVGPPHRDAQDVLDLTLSDVLIDISIGGVAYPAGSTIPLTTGVEYEITVTTSGPDAFYLGILVRFESTDASQDLTTAITEPGSLQRVTTCPGPTVVGLTHRDNTMKFSERNIFLQVPTPDVIVMDVTIVIINTDTASAWGYGTFNLDLQNGDGVPTVSTTPEPTVAGTLSATPSSTISFSPSPFIVAPTTLQPIVVGPPVIAGPTTIAPTFPVFPPSTLPPVFLTSPPVFLTPAPVFLTPAPVFIVVPTPFPVVVVPQVPTVQVPTIGTIPPSRRYTPGSSVRQNNNNNNGEELSRRKLME